MLPREIDPDSHFSREELVEKVLKEHGGIVGCPFCKVQIRDGDRFIVKYKRNEALFKQPKGLPKYTFYELLRDLSQDLDNPKQKKKKGFQILMPETLLVHEAKLEVILQMDKEFRLVTDNKT